MSPLASDLVLTSILRSHRKPLRAGMGVKPDQRREGLTINNRFLGERYGYILTHICKGTHTQNAFQLLSSGKNQERFKTKVHTGHRTTHNETVTETSSLTKGNLDVISECGDRVILYSRRFCAFKPNYDLFLAKCKVKTAACPDHTLPSGSRRPLLGDGHLN